MIKRFLGLLFFYDKKLPQTKNTYKFRAEKVKNIKK